MIRIDISSIMLVLEKWVKKEMVFYISGKRILIEYMAKMNKEGDLIKKIINRRVKEKEKDLNLITRNSAIKIENDLFKLSSH